MLILVACGEEKDANACGETEDFTVTYGLQDFALSPEGSSLGFNGDAVLAAQGKPLTGVCALSPVDTTTNAEVIMEALQGRITNLKLQSRVRYADGKDPVEVAIKETCRNESCRYNGGAKVELRDAYCTRSGDEKLTCRPATLVPVLVLSFNAPSLEGLAPAGLLGLQSNPAVSAAVGGMMSRDTLQSLEIAFVGKRAKGQATAVPMATATSVAPVAATAATASEPTATPRPTSTPRPTATTATTPTAVPRQLMNVNTEFSGNVKSQDGSRNVDWEVFFTGSWGHQSPGIDSQEAGLKHVLQGSVISVTGNGEGTFPDNVSGPCLKGDRLFEYGRIEIRFHIQGNKIVSTNSYQGGVLFPVVEISGTWSLERATIEVPRQGGEWSYYYTEVLPDPSRRSSLKECGQADPARWPLVASGTLTGKAGVTFPNQVHLALGGWQLSDFNWNGLVSVPAASGNAFPVTPSR